MAETNRQYAVAYRANNGTVCPLGYETVWLPGAEAELERLQATEPDGDLGQLFIAWRTLPAWEEISASDRRDFLLEDDPE